MASKKPLKGKSKKVMATKALKNTKGGLDLSKSIDGGSVKLNAAFLKSCDDPAFLKSCDAPVLPPVDPKLMP
jgi:hypothetical protein